MEWVPGAIEELSEGSCPVVATQRPLTLECGATRAPRSPRALQGADFVVLYILNRQRGLDRRKVRHPTEHGTLVAARTIDGVNYVENWDPDPNR